MLHHWRNIVSGSRAPARCFSRCNIGCVIANHAIRAAARRAYRCKDDCERYLACSAGREQRKSGDPAQYVHSLPKASGLQSDPAFRFPSSIFQRYELTETLRLLDGLSILFARFQIRVPALPRVFHRAGLLFRCAAAYWKCTGSRRSYTAGAVPRKSGLVIRILCCRIVRTIPGDTGRDCTHFHFLCSFP
jgi:hypothetical protein